MDRSASRYHSGGPRLARAPQAVPAQLPARHSAAAATLMLLMRLIVAIMVVAAIVLLGPGFVLDAPQPAPRISDAIVVISGDEQMARFAEGVNLYQQGFGKYLVFSGAAYDNGTSNADVMRSLAVERGIPESAILEEPQGEDTWGNAVYTRRVLEDHDLQSAILVTSPYHLRRAQVTFDAAYAGSGIQLTVHAAPDSQWRKLSWWQQAETRRLTFTELQKLAYIVATGQYH
ncbi:MAG: YdcF family protein [Chloroflexi bacterium]|nr:YdcF family protein [Chloroflexota bacterium]